MGLGLSLDKMTDDASQNDRKKKKYSPARYVGAPNIEKIQGQFLAVLKREAQRLMDESYKGKLSESSSKELKNYLKLIMDLKKPTKDRAPADHGDEEPNEEEAFDSLSDEELKKLATKGDKDV